MLPGSAVKICCLERYRMEEKYFPEINGEFLLALKANLIAAFKHSSNLDVATADFDSSELWSNLMGTMGYAEAFRWTCFSLGTYNLLYHYFSLKWDESDRFDSKVLDLAIKYGIVKLSGGSSDGN